MAGGIPAVNYRAFDLGTRIIDLVEVDLESNEFKHHERRGDDSDKMERANGGFQRRGWISLHLSSGTEREIRLSDVRSSAEDKDLCSSFRGVFVRNQTPSVASSISRLFLPTSTST